MAQSHSIDSEIKKVTIDFNNTNFEYNKNKTIIQLFEEQVERIPLADAVICNNEKLSYKELNEKSNMIARFLRAEGVKRETIIGIMVDRSFEMMIGIFGILKAGGAYLPISIDNPSQRKNQIISDSKIPILLTKSNVNNSDISNDLKIINLDDEDMYIGDDSNLPLINKPTDIAYVIYTSGSTGIPKGVLIEHYSLINRLNWMQRQYPISESDTILQKTPYFFDVSVWEIFWWSVIGAKVCLLKHGYEKYPQAIIETVEKENVSITHFVPSMLNAFLNYIEDSEHIKRLSSLKQVFVSGEALSTSVVNNFNKTLNKNNKTKLANLYGPTEATVDVSYFDCPEIESIDKVPIGKPIDNTSFYIIKNDELKLIGEEGELCIAGDGLSRGYLNRPELTNEKFVEDFKIDKLNKEIKKFYKTGDLACWMPNGDVEFLGRIDHQVKIRGLRIELGEIESRIRKFEGITDCIVLAKNSSESITLIYAIVTPENLIQKEIALYLKDYLPQYMLPNKYVFLNELPLTNNGKVNRKLLEENC
ncbi:MAG: amino acid adenylation domain-containing protein [Bacteroidales bacterium]|nr:amino acid adenylation domain-containing protein [Bacteroidales bacterium]